MENGLKNTDHSGGIAPEKADQDIKIGPPDKNPSFETSAPGDPVSTEAESQAGISLLAQLVKGLPKGIQVRCHNCEHSMVISNGDENTRNRENVLTTNGNEGQSEKTAKGNRAGKNAKLNGTEDQDTSSTESDQELSDDEDDDGLKPPKQGSYVRYKNTYRDSTDDYFYTSERYKPIDNDSARGIYEKKKLAKDISEDHGGFPDQQSAGTASLKNDAAFDVVAEFKAEWQGSYTTSKWTKQKIVKPPVRTWGLQTYLYIRSPLLVDIIKGFNPQNEDVMTVDTCLKVREPYATLVRNYDHLLSIRERWKTQAVTPADSEQSKIHRKRHRLSCSIHGHNSHAED
ncbi:hypothetical protein B9Z65_1862 [Elsinoe australis]|uniref:Uncharacterized protein n=1 Tax=Elsinoe australis TaxID=40998 RepID=A0A2P7YL40_9PEZI|nr:hypothetical protein B9Z65_1862 [Elsinoe australis]